MRPRRRRNFRTLSARTSDEWREAVGRKPNQRQRIGHLENKRLEGIIRQIRSFPLKPGDIAKTESDLNGELNAWIQEVEPTWTNKQHVKVPFADVHFNPDGTLPSTTARPPLVACEGKKLVAENPQKAWKEGLGQAFTYRVLFKAAVLVLYDFTPAGHYGRALGPGNSVESSFAAKIRKNWRIHIVPLKPKAP